MVNVVKILLDYYTEGPVLYYFPFLFQKGKNYDYIDFKYLNGKNAALVAEWDSPITFSKEGRSSCGEEFRECELSGEFDIINMNYTTIIDNINTVLK